MGNSECSDDAHSNDYEDDEHDRIQFEVHGTDLYDPVWQQYLQEQEYLQLGQQIEKHKNGSSSNSRNSCNSCIIKAKARTKEKVKAKHRERQ